MEYAVVLCFNKTVEDKINSLIHQIANETGNKYMVDNNIPPHVTISLFKYDEDIDTIIKIVENNISKFNKNKIGIASIGIFNPNVLFLSPIMNDYLIESNKNISKIIKTNDKVLLDKNYVGNQWIPHISLAVKLNKEELVNGFKILMEYFEVLEIETNRIGLVKCNPYKNIKEWKI
jgi:2'-5' RNA ligase